MAYLTFLLTVICSAFSFSVHASSANHYIADNEYLSYRLELVSSALDDPIIKERLQSAQSIDEYREILQSEIREKLRKYREENDLDENGVRKATPPKK